MWNIYIYVYIYIYMYVCVTMCIIAIFANFQLSTYTFCVILLYIASLSVLLYIVFIIWTMFVFIINFTKMSKSFSQKRRRTGHHLTSPSSVWHKTALSIIPSASEFLIRYHGNRLETTLHKVIIGCACTAAGVRVWYLTCEPGSTSMVTGRPGLIIPIHLASGYWSS